MNTEQEKWARSLERWAIPSEILAQSQTSPWILPPARFQIPDEIPATVSSEKALEALPHSGQVLDVGCGGGIASFGLTPRVAHVMGVDHEREMLSMFAQNAEKREISCQVFEGFWPEIADQVPVADVVLCHHVLYNISEIGPFLLGLNSHALSRVVTSPVRGTPHEASPSRSCRCLDGGVAPRSRPREDT